MMQGQVGTSPSVMTPSLGHGVVCGGHGRWDGVQAGGRRAGISGCWRWHGRPPQISPAARLMDGLGPGWEATEAISLRYRCSSQERDGRHLSDENALVVEVQLAHNGDARR